MTPPPAGPVLRDIHLPPAPPWWPPAPGWWALAAVLLLVVLLAGWLWRRRQRVQRVRRQWLGEVDTIAQRHARDGDVAALAASLHQLLRRVARGHDASAVRQQGEAWQRTLARVPVDGTTLGRLVALETVIYRASTDFDSGASLAAARTWLRAAAKPRAWKAQAAESGHV